MKQDNSTGCILTFIMLILTPYYLTCLTVTVKLIENGIVWHRAIVYGYVWPMWIISFVIDGIMKVENGG